jgi:hypothetical protein
MDPVQTTIIIISFVLTTLFVILGFQVFAILKEMRISLQKMNSMLDDAKHITSTVGQSVGALAGAAAGIKTAFSFLHKFKKQDTKEEV